MKYSRTKIALLTAFALAPIAARAATMWVAGEGAAPSNTSSRDFILCNISNSSSLGVNESNGCGGQVVLDLQTGFAGVVASGAALISGAATPGTLKTFAESDVTNLPHVQNGFLTISAYAWATASFQDTVTIQPPGIPVGTPGFMQPVFSVHGPVSAGGSLLGGSSGVFVVTGTSFNSGEFGDQAPDFASAAIGLNAIGGFFLIDPVGVTPVFGTAQGRTFTSQPIPILFGMPHAFSAHLESWTSPCGNCNGLTPTQLISFSGIVDLSHTANLTGFIVTDSAGNPIQGSSITGLGGLDYNSLGSAAAPEPASWMLIACGGVLLCCRYRRWLPALAVALLSSAAASANSNSLTVAGVSDIWLASQPNGTVLSTGFGGSDVVPANSPVLASTGLTLAPGGILTFSVSGTINFGGCVSPSPDGAGVCSTFTGNPFFGISSYVGPINALVGVFLDNNTPAGSAPAGLDFTSPASQSQPVASPQLRQVFFIGDGLTGTGSGAVQQFVIPAGATRLFLASSDGPGASFNNSSSFAVTVTESAAASPAPGSAPQGVPAGSTLMLALTGILLIGAAAHFLRAGARSSD